MRFYNIHNPLREEKTINTKGVGEKNNEKMGNFFRFFGDFLFFLGFYIVIKICTRNKSNKIWGYKKKALEDNRIL